MLYHVYMVLNPETNSLSITERARCPQPFGREGGTGSRKLFACLKVPLCCPSCALVLEWRSFLLYIAKDKQAFRVVNTKAWSGDVYLGVGTDGVSLASGEYFRI